MVAVHNPLTDLELNETAAAYVGVLERQILGLTVQELRFRALVEVLTGDDWSDIKADLEAGEIEKIAVAALERKGISHRDARRQVRKNIAASKLNPEVAAPDESGAGVPPVD